MVNWAHDKGIIPASENAWGFATIVGRKIADKGTDRYSNNVDVYSTPLNNAIEKIRNTILTDIVEQTQTHF